MDIGSLDSPLLQLPVNGFSDQDLQELRDAFFSYLLSLLPPGRYPAEGGIAYDFLKAVGYSDANNVKALLERVYVWFASEASEAALYKIAAARSLERFGNEDLTRFRRRVIGAYDFWGKAGTLPGMIVALEQMGFYPVVVEHYLTEPDKWAEFSVFLYQNDVLFAELWGDGTTWGDDGYWGMESIDGDLIKRIIRNVKPAHAKLRSAYLVVGPANAQTDIWDGPDSTWDDGETWPELLLTEL